MNLIPCHIDDLTPEERSALLRRSMEDVSSEYDYVRGIVNDVRQRGDVAVVEGHRGLGLNLEIDSLEVSPEEITEAYDRVEGRVVDALRAAAVNITRFHRAQLDREMWSVEVAEGVMAGRITRPLDRVGCYVPGGRAAYPSTTLMTVLPARVAGVHEIVAATPPGEGSDIPPATLVALDIAGCDRVFRMGGPWGIAAMTHGTETVPKVDKIVGPGNRYVTAAKMVVYGEVDIDSPAGPSESLILADETGEVEFLALDFLSQTEHDPDSAAVLVTTSRDLAARVCERINTAVGTLPRRDIIEASVAAHGKVLVAHDLDQAVEFANEYAPEHLQIITRDPFIVLAGIRHAGSIFLGPYAPVAAGDYASGTNHVLPTGRAARMFSGLSVDDFLKKPTFQYLSRNGLEGLKDTIITLAEAEGLPVHARAVRARFEGE
ncbi:MAG: histidinol dehydrogenase [Thermodesulfobacteriota bacterium]